MANTPEFLLLYRVPSAAKPEATKEGFLEFVKDGAKKPNGEFEEDGHGNKMTGVIAWLRDNELHDTRIYTVDNADGLTFIATADSVLPDWADIAGFEDRFGPNTRMKIRDDLNALVANPIP